MLLPQKWQVLLAWSTFYAKCTGIPLWLLPPTSLPLPVSPPRSGPALRGPFSFNDPRTSSHRLAFLDPVYLGGADQVGENSWLGSAMHVQLRVTHATWVFENDQVMLRAFHWNPARKCRWSMPYKEGAVWRNEQLSSLLWQWKKLYLIGENLSKQMLGEVFIFPLSFFLWFFFSICWAPPEED